MHTFQVYNSNHSKTGKEHHFRISNCSKSRKIMNQVNNAITSPVTFLHALIIIQKNKHLKISTVKRTAKQHNFAYNRACSKCLLRNKLIQIERYINSDFLHWKVKFIGNEI